MKINRLRSAAFMVPALVGVCASSMLQSGGRAETNTLSGPPQLVRTITNRSGEVVDRHRDQWAYQSLALLTRAILPKVYDSVQRGKELTRGEFARIVLTLRTRRGALDAAKRQRRDGDDIKDAAGNLILSVADFYGLLGNLESEFADELALLRVQRLGGKLSLLPVQFEPAHLRSDGQFPAIAELDKRLYPAVMMMQPRAVRRLENSAIFIEYHPRRVALEHRAVASDVRQQGITCSVLTGVGEPVQPLTLPAEIADVGTKTHLNRYELGVLSDPRLMPTLPANRRGQDNNAEYVDTRRQRLMYDLIRKLSRMGIIEGYSDGTFRGSFFMTRYEFAVALARMLNDLPRNAAARPQVPGAAPARKWPQGLDTRQTWELDQGVAALYLEFAPEILQFGQRARQLFNAGLAAKLDEGTTIGPVYFWLTLSYAKDADPQLIEQIKQTIGEYAALSRETIARQHIRQ